MDFREYLKDVRGTLSKKAFSDFLEMNQSDYVKIETGKTLLRESTIRKIAEKLDCDVEIVFKPRTNQQLSLDLEEYKQEIETQEKLKKEQRKKNKEKKG